MQPVLSTLDFGNTSKISNLADGVSPQDAVTMAQLNAAIEGLAWKDNARTAATVNVNLAAPGASIGGVALAANDRVLAMAQTAPAENGIYIFNGSAVAMTRSLDANTFAELESAVVTVDEGASAGSTFRQSAVNGTLGSTAIVWASFGTSAPAATTATPGIAALATQAEVDAGLVSNKIVTPETLKAFASAAKRFATNIGDASATMFLINHNLNTFDVVVNVFLNSGSRDTVLCDVKRNTVNQVQIGPLNMTIGANAYRVVIVG